MAKSVADKIHSAMLYDHINILRLSEFERIKAEKLLLDLRKKIITQLVNKDPLSSPRTAIQKRRLKALYAEVNNIIEANFEKLSVSTQDALRGMAKYTSKSTPKIINKAIGIDVMTGSLSMNRIKALVNGSMVDGKLIGSWWSKQAANFKSKFKDTMEDIAVDFRTSVASGESLGAIVNSISSRGALMGYALSQVNALVRTAYMQVASDTREEIYKENSEILFGTRFVATLDRRTTLLCQSLDGSMWDSEGKGLQGTSAPYSQPPLHWNCRSILVPITLNYSDMSKVRPQLKELDAGKRASMNGSVSANTTYESWFKELPRRTQEEILGKARFKLFTRGKLSAADMIRLDGTPLNISELTEKVDAMGL